MTSLITSNFSWSFLWVIVSSIFLRFTASYYHFGTFKLFLVFSLGNCIVYLSSIYGFLLPLWYLQTFLIICRIVHIAYYKKNQNHLNFILLYYQFSNFLSYSLSVYLDIIPSFKKCPGILRFRKWIDAILIYFYFYFYLPLRP